MFPEVAGRRGVKLDTLWLRGGFTDAFLARDADQWQRWQEGYVRTFVEREVARHRVTLSASEVRRLMTMVYNGTRTFAASDKIRVVPAAEILIAAGKW